MEYESKLVVPNKWDNSRLDLYISIGELVKPLYKRTFSKLIFATIFATCCNHIFFIGIIYKMRVIIDDFVYFDYFCYAN